MKRSAPREHLDLLVESLDFICGAWWWEVPELVTKVEAVCVECMHTISTCIYQLQKQNTLGRTVFLICVYVSRSRSVFGMRDVSQIDVSIRGWRISGLYRVAGVAVGRVRCTVRCEPDRHVVLSFIS